MRVLVCGSRDWWDRRPTHELVDSLPGAYWIEGWARGADTLTRSERLRLNRSARKRGSVSKLRALAL